MDRERRRDARVPVDILVNKFVDGTAYACRARDISRGGLRLQRISEPARVRNHIALQFMLPGQPRVIVCGGQVVYQNEQVTGVRFTSVSERNRRLLDSFLDQRTVPPAA